MEHNHARAAAPIPHRPTVVPSAVDLDPRLRSVEEPPVEIEVCFTALLIGCFTVSLRHA